MISIWHILPDSWVPGSACTLVKYVQEGVDMDMAMCQNANCPSKTHCYRFIAAPDCHQVYAHFTVKPKEDRCEYYIPSQMEGTDGPVQA